MADVFMAVRGQLTNPSKAALRKAGVVVVEVDDLSQCRFVRASELVSGDDMLYAAMSALRERGGTYSVGDYQRQAFADTISELVSNAWTEAKS